MGLPQGAVSGALQRVRDVQPSGRGVGSGILLDRCRFPVAEPNITLLDSSPSALEFVSDRVRRYEPSTCLGSVLDPWDLPAESFGSVGMLNILHCVPGTIREKAVAFEQARAVLKPGGVLFGATVLNLGVEHTRRSRVGIAKLNRRGIFCNLGDGLEDLDAVLGDTFSDHRIELQGIVALFVAHAGNEGSPDGR